MTQIARQFVIVSLWALSTQHCKGGSDFCALTVQVSGINGEAISGATATLKDEKSNVVQHKPVDGGVVEFCDFGFGRHSLVIEKGCSMEIHDVYIKFGIEQKFKGIVNPCRGPSGGDVGGNACFVFV